jgi:hypothetical protein
MLPSNCDQLGKPVLPAFSPHQLLITDLVIEAHKAGRLCASRPSFERCGNGPTESHKSTSDVDGCTSHCRQVQECCMDFQKARLGTVGAPTRAKARFVPSRPAISIREKELHERRNVTGKRQVHIDETETRKSSGI